MVTSPPAWKILAVGVFIIAIEVLVDGLASPPMVSRHVRSVMGPVSCGTIILAGEVAYHRYRQRTLEASKPAHDCETWEL